MSNGGRGFTLLEIMLVMVILAGLAMLAIGRPPDERAQREGEKLALAIRGIAQRAELENRIYGIAVFTNGLRIQTLKPYAGQGQRSESWPDFAWQQASAVKKRPGLSAATRLKLSAENKSIALQAMAERQEPQLLFLPDDEASEFTLELYYREEKAGEIISRNGTIEFTPTAGDAREK
ncbi:type II secretion system protein [Kalamiella sp. sgz302252]|uniref:type II secretion system protein n=1 Tax=Pantoea sp. sgz302252 TaxID=3341827 RepID=UPI0036D2C181